MTALFRERLLALAFALAAVGLGVTLFRPADPLLLDALQRRQAPAKPVDSRLLLVDIDDYSMARMQPVAGRWPWSRAVHAALLEGLAPHEPRAVVFDLLFADNDLDRGGDDYFAEVLAPLDFVFLPTLHLRAEPGAAVSALSDYPPAVGVQPGPGARPGARAELLLSRKLLPAAPGRMGTINFEADDDGVGRRYDVRREIEGWHMPSLAAAVARAAGAALPDRPRILLNWHGAGTNPYRTVPYADLYELVLRQAEGDAQAGARLADWARGRVLVVGTTAAGLHDLRPTPIDVQQPAVMMLMTAIDNLLNDAWLREPPAWIGPALSALTALAIAALIVLAVSSYGRTLAYVIAMLAAITGILVAAADVALARRVALPVAAPILAAWTAAVLLLVQRGLGEYLQRRQAVQLFSRFLDPGIVRQLLGRGVLDPQSLNKSCELTVLFSDIRGFTTLSEERSAEEVVDLLNRYFSRQVEVVFRHGGTLDKFIGDAVMAFWGAPADDPHHARHAVAAALEMCDVLAEFRRELGALGERFDIGIGLHTGPAVVGMIGSQMRYDYTAIGDTVNLASRIEGLTKGLARILVSEETRAAASDAFDFRDMGVHSVKGRSEQVRLYEPARRPA